MKQRVGLKLVVVPGARARGGGGGEDAPGGKVEGGKARSVLGSGGPRG